MSLDLAEAGVVPLRLLQQRLGWCRLWRPRRYTRDSSGNTGPLVCVFRNSAVCLQLQLRRFGCFLQLDPGDSRSCSFRLFVQLSEGIRGQEEYWIVRLLVPSLAPQLDNRVYRRQRLLLLDRVGSNGARCLRTVRVLPPKSVDPAIRASLHRHGPCGCWVPAPRFWALDACHWQLRLRELPHHRSAIV